jgi:hypothetical protein
MLQKVDAALLRAFQWTSDLILDWTGISNFFIAKIVLTAIAGFTLTVGCLDFSKGTVDLSTYGTFMMLFFLWAYFLPLQVRVEREAKSNPSYANPLTDEFTFYRESSSVIIPLTYVLGYAIDNSTHDHILGSGLFIDRHQFWRMPVDIFSYILYFYFASVRVRQRNNPRQRFRLSKAHVGAGRG